MLDSLALTLALIATPTQRPNMERVATVRTPVATSFVQVARAQESEPEKVTTCYLNNSVNCWSEN